MPAFKKENEYAVRSLRDSWVPGLKQILFKVFIKDPGTKSERPPTLFRRAISMDDTRKNWIQERTGLP